MVDIYKELSVKRKEAQEKGEFPSWATTGSYQMFVDKYLYKADSFEDQIKRIAKTLAPYAVKFIPEQHEFYKRITEHHGNNWEDCFYSIMWNGDFQPSTPVLSNTGTDRGMSVSCSGGVVDDSVYGFYDAAKEIAMLSKMAFGTSSYLGNIRPAGSPISTGGLADGTSLPKALLQDTARRISQGSVRRGAVALYLPVDHPDFEDWVVDLLKNPQGQNIGWNFSDEEIKLLKEGLNDPENSDAHRRLAKIIKTKMIRGKGYFWKPDSVNRRQPPWYTEYGWKNYASNLC